MTRSWMKSSKRVSYISGKHTKYIYYDDGNTRVTLSCLSRLIYDLYCTELYKLYSNFGGNYIPYDDGNHRSDLVRLD